MYPLCRVDHPAYSQMDKRKRKGKLFQYVWMNDAYPRSLMRMGLARGIPQLGGIDGLQKRAVASGPL